MMSNVNVRLCYVVRFATLSDGFILLCQDVKWFHFTLPCCQLISFYFATLSNDAVNQSFASALRRQIGQKLETFVRIASLIWISSGGRFDESYSKLYILFVWWPESL